MADEYDYVSMWQEVIYKSNPVHNVTDIYGPFLPVYGPWRPIEFINEDVGYIHTERDLWVNEDDYMESDEEEELNACLGMYIKGE